MMDAQTQEHLKRIERDHEMMKLHAGNSYLGGVTEFPLQLVREQESKLKVVEEQFQIAVEHWEMYEDQFVDVEREACAKTRQILEALE